MQWNGGANAPDWLRDWVQHNFRRTQLPPSTEENISRLQGTAVQHNFRRTLLVPSREENIRIWALRYSIASGARNYCHLGRKIEVAWTLRCSITSGARCWCHLGRKISVAWALRYSITSGARCTAGAIYGRRISVAWALRYNITWRRSMYVPTL